MWTHKDPYQPTEFTRESIEREGRLGLSRALNVGRVIGFVGSGATRAYGRPSWGELVDVAIDQVEAASAAEPFERESVTRLLTQLKTIKKGADPSRLLLALGTVEELAERLGVLARIRQEISEKIAERSRAKAQSERSRRLGAVCEEGGGGSKFFEDALKTTGLSARAQPLEAAMRDLRLNRFLTLNYDLEIEREFHRWHRTTGAEARDATAAREIGGRRDRRSDFDVLCGFGDESERGPDLNLRLRDLPHDVKHVDGTRPSVRSNTLHPGNVGDLVNFAMHPRTFEAQVFHLHGRCDKPAEMVLTEKDYQRVYLGSGEQEHTFDEALSAIFAGNEVLFIGVGMDETDMLRPLRQFVSQDNAPDFARRPVYALMERDCTLSLDFGDVPDKDQRELFIEEVKEQATRRSSLDQAGEKLASYQTAKRDRIMENARALELKSQYGVHVIYYGDQELRDHRLRAQLMRKLAELVDVVGGKPVQLPGEFRTAWETLQEPLSTKVDPDRSPLIHENEGRPEDEEPGPWLKWLDALSAKVTEGEAFPALDAADLKRLKDFAYLYEDEMRARALARELSALSKARDEWWEAWRKIPSSRRAEYPTKTGEKAAKLKDNYATESWGANKPKGWRDTQIQSRHRAVYRDLPTDWTRNLLGEKLTQVKKLQSLGAELEKERKKHRKRILKATGELHYDHGDPEGVRVLRCAIPRGGGKGSLVFALQQFVHANEKTPRAEDRAVLNEIFENDPDFRYRYAFCFNLSFSMEFASVIEALRRFFKKALKEALQEHREKLAPLVDEPESDKDNHLLKQLRVFRSEVGGKTNWLDDSQAEEFVNKAEARDPNPNRQRQQHRVDRLRHFMELYRDLAVLSSGVDQHRVFVCFAGLDALCDGDGLARNPMFRAFFRLLTGCEARRKDEAPANMPLDLLLISGEPESPIRYLSATRRISELRQREREPTEGGDADYRMIRDEPDLVLVKWPLAPSIPLDERYWLEPIAEYDGEGKTARVIKEIRKSLTHEPSSGKPTDYPYLRGLVEDSVALSSWLFGAAQLLREDKERPEKKVAEAYLKRVEAAAARSGAMGALAEIMLVHDENVEHAPALRIEAQCEWIKGRDVVFAKAMELDAVPEATISNDGDKRLIEAAKEKTDAVKRLKALLDGLNHESGGETARARQRNRQRMLATLVLQHLAAFPMPIETRVLYGCPEIKTILVRDLRDAWRDVAEATLREAKVDADTLIEKAEGEEKRRIEKQTEKKKVKLQKLWRGRARKMRWRSREFAMQELEDALTSMRKLGLIIEVERRRRPEPDEDAEPARDSHHVRYTVHAQMRDFLAHQMRFFTPDRGERNYFQVSLYCDQPRDLPTPTQEHYLLFRAILDGQISAVQRSLWHFYQYRKLRNSNGTADPQMSDVGLVRFVNGFTRRLCGHDENGEEVFDQSLVSIHAIPQRIRALYGLLRAGFSVGAISRLSRYRDDKVADQPYERFRGWLRSLTNAAVAMDERRNELLAVAGWEIDDHGKPKRSGAITIDLSPVSSDVFPDPNADEPPPTAVEPPAMPLYRDEIGWLLNERGVISLTQGHLFDAIPLFERALIVMRHAANGNRDDPALHAASRRVRLNLAIAQIDRGNLYRARRIVEELRLPEGLSSHRNSLVNILGRGYLGFIDQMSGHFASAETLYGELIAEANDRQMLRVVSIFNRKKADLKRAMGAPEEALPLVDLAINAARQAEQRDILHMARLSEAKAKLASEMGARDVDMAHVERALTFAQEMGVPRLEAEALRVQAEAKLATGESIVAGREAARAAAIAARSGLRVQKIAALTVYARALAARGHRELSRDVGMEARAEAERLGVQTRAGTLADHLASKL